VDALDLLRRYLGCLEAGDFISAANCFTPDARYSHPPYAGDPPGSGRHEAQGTAEILSLFERRGSRSTQHEITATACTGDRYFISGLIRDGDGAVAGSFVSEAVFNPEAGKFDEYAAYSSRPAVWAGAA
jgi:ketosteroid isomerase-like protein